MADPDQRACRHRRFHSVVSGRSASPTFFRNPAIEIYYSRVTRKELLHRPISDAEKARVLRLLAGLRLINPDNQIAAAYSDLLSRYGYLRVHLADALIAASAWVKNLPLVTTNLRHFQQIREIEVIPF